MKSNSLIVILILIGLITSCDKDNNVNVASSVSGNISYNGNYSGQNLTIYIRGYTSNANAIGIPEYSTSITQPGSYTLDLGSYTGDLYLSAFMDIDNSGNSSGPSANEILVDGVYADPIGCYGDYTFVSTGPTIISVDGAKTGINFELKDCGVIKVSFSNTGVGTFGVIRSHVMSEPFLHHRHCDVKSTTETFLLVVPGRNNWDCKVKFEGQSTPQLYPSAINVIANSITEISF
ncbi:MAG: hypothetical protein OEW67_10735 [Cyclobacteriaceae bacterium]|nr:hypothetical protein [Cyclobacteriaceae bacterium]